MSLVSGLAAYYRLDGSPWDASGNGRDLTASNVTYGPGVLGQAMTGGHATVNYAPQGTLADGDLSVSGWVYAQAGTGTVAFSPGGHYGYDKFIVQYQAKSNTTRQVYASLDNASWTSTAVTVPADAWAHVAITWNAALKRVRLYLNGTLRTEQTATPAYQTFAQVQVYAKEVIGITSPKDEVGLWVRELTPTEVGLLYNSGAGLDPTVNRNPRTACWKGDAGVTSWVAGGSAMSAVLTSGNAQKAAGDTVRVSLDFGDIKQLIAGASIVSFDVTAAGLPVSGKLLDFPYQVSALVSGGVAGQKYDCVFTITLNDADATVITRTGVLQVF